MEQWNNFSKEMKTRTMLRGTGDDILRWGYRLKGMFIIEEPYHIKSNNHQALPGLIWNKIWSVNLWPKVEYFMWFLTHRKTLTWDHLQHRGIQGPSLCVM